MIGYLLSCTYYISYTDISVLLGQTCSGCWLNHIDHTSVRLSQADSNYNAVVMYVLKITWFLTCMLLNSLHTQYGQTPLTIARSEGHEHIVQLLHEASRQR